MTTVVSLVFLLLEPSKLTITAQEASDSTGDAVGKFLPLCPLSVELAVDGLAEALSEVRFGSMPLTWTYSLAYHCLTDNHFEAVFPLIFKGTLLSHTTRAVLWNLKASVSFRVFPNFVGCAFAIQPTSTNLFFERVKLVSPELCYSQDHRINGQLVVIELENI